MNETSRHDPLCPATLAGIEHRVDICRCEEYARVRADRSAEVKAALYTKDERIAELLYEREQLIEVLGFYADPSTYYAIAFWPDSPCGDFVDDFSEDHGDPFYGRAMPGKRARAVLALLDIRNRIRN